MRLILAPMEGVVDAQMRQLLTGLGGYDLCVTEFVRVTEQKLPAKVFYRLCPELANDGKTASGTPVRVQLLGQSPEWLSLNAMTAIELGSPGIDLNFGCPAKTVNKSRGGAVLLKEPELIYQIVKAVREAVPSQYPVSAKIRLGYEDTNQTLEIADAVAQANASELTVHARTKKDGYRAPAYWGWIAKIRQHVTLPVIANGEIWDRESLKQCQEQSGAEQFMVGRGAVATPNLGAVLKTATAKMSWNDVLSLLIHFAQQPIDEKNTIYYPSRTKQWFSYLKLSYPQANDLFRQIRILKDRDAILNELERAQN
ncbi:tRNA dihydrouridine(16) synthase DusC [Celerinatantimonas sp. MCCC 1A17872]|uniref:tRNA dihydrouridine(16) synthase DusC n=1 Tax=Celerinatantimonas sp. MCCC 1A17872 TaxID=3177514 RepID=UPI0038C80CBF